MKPAQKLLALALAAIVLYPIAHQAAVGSTPRWIPWQVAEFWRFTSLFSSKVDAWPAYHVIAVDHEGHRHVLPQDPVSTVKLYGHFTRLDRLLLVLDRNSHDDDAARTIAAILDPVAAAYAALVESQRHPGSTPPRIERVEFRRSLHYTDRTAAPASPWSRKQSQDDPAIGDLLYAADIDHE